MLYAVAPLKGDCRTQPDLGPCLRLHSLEQLGVGCGVLCCVLSLLVVVLVLLLSVIAGLMIDDDDLVSVG